ncbi:MAG TPA: GNAT family N-acetyltransferase [Gaiellaceae bacterium]
MADSSLRLELARTAEGLEALRTDWQQLPWEREEAAYEYFTTRLRTRPETISPFAAIVYEDGAPVAGLAGRLESRRLDTALGYKVLYAPLVRYLRIVDGGIVAPEGPARALLLGALSGVLARGEADVLGLPAFEVDSSLGDALAALAGPLERQPFVAPWMRRRLVLPESFDEFLGSRSHKTRKGVRQDRRRLDAAFGSRLTVTRVGEPSGLDTLLRDAERVARSTYQRKLGAGFEDTESQRALIEVGLEHGWLRGYLLYLDGDPIAYWLCAVYGETMLLKTGGYDPAHAADRVGIHLLMRVIEDACADPALRILDFGPGDAGYKEQFSSESVRERNLVLFAPTFHARRINATRTAILGPARLARRALDATQLTDKVRTGWRRRLRR